MIEAVTQSPSLPVSPSTSSWRFISTPPLSGSGNMSYDVATLNAVEQGDASPVFRLFSFATPTISYGRLQKPELIGSQIPKNWDSVQRPTGGGIVFHQTDRCLSLCWRNGDAPLPDSPREQYRWIHTAILGALSGPAVRMASCAEIKPLQAAFETRRCFDEAVGYDLMVGPSKIVGGALYRRRGATLYQGSIQEPSGPDLDDRLLNAFRSLLF